VNVVLMCVAAGLLSSCAKEQKEYDAILGFQDPNSVVPTALQTVGVRAEELIAAASVRDWPRVYAYVRDISDAWSFFKSPTVEPVPLVRPPATLLYGRLDVALAQLQDAAAAREPRATMRAAGDVAEAAIELSEFYNPGLSRDLYRLEVLERRIIIDAADDRIEIAGDAWRNLRDTWNRVRTTLSGQAGDNLIRAFDDSIAAQQAALRAGDALDLSANATEALTLVDRMELLSYGP
jgi:hypothetical protein